MGIAHSTIRLISREMKALDLSGSCITLGVQGIDGQYSDIKRILTEEKYNYYEIAENKILYDPLTQFGNTIHQNSFFKMLGFANVDSLDYYDNDKPSYVANLNKPLRVDLYNKYDMVYDGGTLEHCFNTKEVLCNVIRLLKVGGRVVHHVPMTGWVEHGFYQFSPGLFFDFYGANGFINMKATIHLFGKRSYCIDYDPKLTYAINYMKKIAFVLFIAQKGEEINDIKEPIQSSYLNTFGEKAKSTINQKNSSDYKNLLKKSLQKLPISYLSALFINFAQKLEIIVNKIYIYKNMVKLK